MSSGASARAVSTILIEACFHGAVLTENRTLKMYVDPENEELADLHVDLAP